MAYDWSKFRTRIPVKAGIQEIYDAWTTAVHIQKWFLRSAEYTTPDGSIRQAGSPVEAGDQYTWMWFGYGNDVYQKGRIIEANGKNLFRFSFEGNCEVSVSIQEEAGEVVVELVQSNIPLDDKSRANIHVGCSGGWTFYLANLKSILEGGIDLRNKNENIKNVISS